MPNTADLASNIALYASLEALEAGIDAMGNLPPEYVDKMQHPLPKATSVDRVEWLLTRLKDRVVLHVGCTGPLHGRLQQVCQKVYGLDREPVAAPDCHVVDLDRLTGPLPVWQDVEIVLCAEVLEHLGNPRFALESLREAYPTQTLMVTAPNAFAEAGRVWLLKGIEQVNREHLWWPSWHTLKTLLEVSGYVPQEFSYYNGKPPVAEGLIFVASPIGQA